MQRLVRLSSADACSPSAPSVRDTSSPVSVAGLPSNSSTAGIDTDSTPRMKGRMQMDGSHPNANGRIELVVGPMFAGKSTELVRRSRRYALTKKRVLVIKHQKDTRYSVECLSTHDRQTVEATACTLLMEVTDKLVDFDVICVDEGQFFPDLLDFSELAANMGKIVIIAALDADFRREPFASVCDLVARAETVTKLTAVCRRCTADAAFTMRVTDDQETEIVGGAELYEPVCRGCYNAYSARKCSSE